MNTSKCPMNVVRVHNLSNLTRLRLIYYFMRQNDTLAPTHRWNQRCAEPAPSGHQWYYTFKHSLIGLISLIFDLESSVKCHLFLIK